MRCGGWLVAVVAVFALVVPVNEAEAQRTAQVPVQVGVGPAGFLLGGPSVEEVAWEGRAFDDQPIHTGLRLSLAAVIDADLIEEHPGMVPSQYRNQLQQMGEVRFSPSIVSLIPTSLYLSPPIRNTSIWGATWSLIGAGLAPISDPIRVTASGSAVLSAIYMNSDAMPRDNFFFLRPGVELQFDFEIPITDDFLISTGWASKVHLPQAYDGGILEMGDFDADSLWHIGEFYIQAHFRFPYSHTYGG